MGCGECCRNCRRKAARWGERTGTRLRNVYFNPEYWHSWISAAMSMWVRQKIVVIWCLIESTISALLAIPILLVPRIDMLDETSLQSYQAMVGVLGLRAISGLLGGFASCFRKVGRTKVYFGAMIANIVLSFFIAQPLASCTCACKGLEDYSPQCQVVYNFRNWLRVINIIGGHKGTVRLDESSDDEPFGPNEEEELMALYNVTDIGVMWTWASVLGCEEVHDEDRAKVRELAFLLSCNKTAFAHRLRELGQFENALRTCNMEPSCALVRLEVISGPSDQDHADYNVCRYAGPIVPYFSFGEYAGHFGECLCKERCVHSELQRSEDCESCTTLKTYVSLRDRSRRRHYLDHAELLKAELQLASFVCRVTINSTFFLLLVLDFLACLMTLVVYEFMKNRCGDFFIEEDMFEARTSRTFTDATSTYCAEGDEQDEFDFNPAAMAGSRVGPTPSNPASRWPWSMTPQPSTASRQAALEMREM